VTEDDPQAVYWSPPPQEGDSRTVYFTRDWRTMSPGDILRDVGELVVRAEDDPFLFGDPLSRPINSGLLPLVGRTEPTKKPSRPLPPPTMTRQQRRYLARKGSA